MYHECIFSYWSINLLARLSLIKFNSSFKVCTKIYMPFVLMDHFLRNRAQNADVSIATPVIPSSRD